MTKAVFQGTFADLRIIKGRKVGQFVIEVPLEGVDHALAALGGVPRPDKEVWVAVARLDPKAVSAAPDEPEEPKKHSLAQQAAILCEDARFQQFLREVYPTAEDNPVEAVRSICFVESRSEFDADPDAAARWRKLHAEYKAWLEL